MDKCTHDMCMLQFVAHGLVAPSNRTCGSIPCSLPHLLRSERWFCVFLSLQEVSGCLTRIQVFMYCSNFLDICCGYIFGFLPGLSAGASTSSFSQVHTFRAHPTPPVAPENKMRVNTVPTEYTSFFVGRPSNRHSLDISQLSSPRINASRIQPPQTLSLCSGLASPLSPLSGDYPQRMSASTESIGICSLDLEAPSRSPIPKSARLVEAASALTLRSGVMSEGGSPSQRQHTPASAIDEVDQAGMRFRSDAFLYLSSEGRPVHFQTDEPTSLPLQESSRLPSYLGISCAISGYSSYSRFCRSRENSPARITPLKPLSLPQNNGELKIDLGPSHFDSSKESISYKSPIRSQSPRDRSSSTDVGNLPRDDYFYSDMKRSPKDSYICNKYFKSPSPEKRFVTSQNIVLSVNGNSHKQKLTNGKASPQSNGVCVNGHKELDTFTNGISSKDWAEEDRTESKSLVEQRIESLFGRPASHVTQPTRMSRSKTRVILDADVAKRSPSCPPQAFRSTSQESPPVFRRIAPDFKEQLRNSPAPDTSGLNKPWYGSPKADISPSQVLNSPLVQLPAKQDQHELAIHSVTGEESHLVPTTTESSLEALSEGHRYLQILENERVHIGKEIEEVSLLLSDPDLPEEAMGKVRSAIGKANLLLSSKLEQFRGLCHKNIHPDSLPEGEFPTTTEDLAGFWDLVLLQVEDVHLTFRCIKELKRNHWKEDKTPVPYDPSSSSGTKPRRPVSSGNKSRSSKSSPTTPEHKVAKPSAAKEAAKAREVQRRLLMEAKRKGRQQAKQLSPATGDEVVEIFIPSSTE